MDSTSSASLARATGTEAALELRSALDRIRHCTDQLTDDQIWERPAPGLNSIGNLLLHLGGNLRQWIVNGLTGAADFRDRPAEFAANGSISKAELLANLNDIVSQACATLEEQTAESLLTPRRIQGFDVNALHAIFHSVPHFRGHAQEIIHMTRFLLGDGYRFAWKPATAEQGAPADPAGTA